MKTGQDKKDRTGLLLHIPASDDWATKQALDRLGVTQYHYLQVRSDPTYAKAVVEFMINQAIKPSEVQRFLATLMPEATIFGPEDWQRYLIRFLPDIKKSGLGETLPLPEDELQKLLQSPCPFLPKKTVADTHFLFWVPEQAGNLNMVRLQEMFPPKGQPRFCSYMDDKFGSCWYRDEKFALGDLVAHGWHLAFKGVVPDSVEKTWEKQEKMMPKQYSVPNCPEASLLHFFYWLKTQEWLSPNIYGRTSSFDSDGNRVNAGNDDPDGLGVRSYWGDGPHPHFAVFASRKLESLVI